MITRTLTRKSAVRGADISAYGSSQYKKTAERDDRDDGGNQSILYCHRSGVVFKQIEISPEHYVSLELDYSIAQPRAIIITNLKIWY